ncbi:MAG: nucleotidyltransferase family protein, partial [Proteobacteria bacterium]|nr:nucleotidyltransferase family protein [Pseudomonadota bacterium]
MIKPLDTETRLLLLCASTRHTEEQKEVIEKLSQDAVNWDHLINLADHHRLMPLLYLTLSSVCPDSTPKEILQRLKQSYKSNATRNFLMTGAIVQINSLCAANNIETLPVKGPLLAATVYGDISLRSFSDIDIMVPDKDIQKTIALLLENKYKLVPTDIPEDIFLKFLKINHDGRLLTDKGFLFELHRDLADWYTPKEMTFESIKPHIKQTKLLGHTV